MEHCPITSACLDLLSDLDGLHYLNVSRSNFTDEFSKLKSLKVLNMGFNDISDVVLAHPKGLTNLESLNLDSCMIKDGGLVYLSCLNRLKCLELSDTEVGNNGLRHHSDVRQITDAGLVALTSLTGLAHLDLFCVKIMDNGTNYVRNLKKLALI
ncbi:F-box/LRR-repeat protein 14-like protein isoform X1 [Tanacetum coccineum]